jgi:hypothetical protein
MNRAIWGRPDEVDRPPSDDAAVDEVFNYDRIPESVTPPDFTSLRTLWETVARLRQQNAPQRQRFEALVIAQRGDNQKLQEMREWWVTRMIKTRRPLQEKLVLFWHGHLVSGRPDARLSENLFAQHELFRRMALGNFKDLIMAISKDPAMLEYLDNENRLGDPTRTMPASCPSFTMVTATTPSRHQRSGQGITADAPELRVLLRRQTAR